MALKRKIYSGHTLKKNLFMKYLITIIFSSFVLSCSIFKKGYTYTEPRIPTKKDFDTLLLAQYQLIRIDTSTYKHNNIFYFKKNDSIFKIATKKEILQPCELLIKNNFYSLKLKGIRPKMILNYLDIGGVMMYGREPVRFERDSGVIWNVYITTYIRGLCYQND